ncbi:hypothetical protein T265_09378 [Opisthorchis viverrini]|uniref:Uncharacterized protein n=1 Tax=Opisthorchis viverrini TaxID=6198 RepID=A0A074Z644_OPIVI|nr:hypothetical protein T265_09378 [Opisthorchis viverrini]KER22548.1 hypothetical protein T265_09378 [Opisthorchis viverrini]
MNRNQHARSSLDVRIAAEWITHLQLVSSAYLMAVPGSEPRRLACRASVRTCSHLSDVIGVPDSLNDDLVTVLVVMIN